MEFRWIYVHLRREKSENTLQISVSYQHCFRWSFDAHEDDKTDEMIQHDGWKSSLLTGFRQEHDPKQETGQGKYQWSTKSTKKNLLTIDYYQWI